MVADAEECDCVGMPRIKATTALNLDVDVPSGTQAPVATQARISNKKHYGTLKFGLFSGVHPLLCMS